MVSDLPLDAIVLDHVLRDRMVVEASEMEELKASIRSNGLRHPVEVIALDAGQYGLISGWRRITALLELRAENAGFATVKAFVRPAPEAGALYTALVEENELRAQDVYKRQVLTLREHLAAEGLASKEYKPWRPKGAPAKICAVANFKGGSGKTTTCAHLAMAAALDGYKVLVIDLDSQGSMTSIFGATVADEWQTVFLSLIHI